MFVHMVTLQGLRRMLLEEAVSAVCPVRDDPTSCTVKEQSERKSGVRRVRFGN